MRDCDSYDVDFTAEQLAQAVRVIAKQRASAGGRARAAVLSPDRRHEIAVAAGQASQAARRRRLGQPEPEPVESVPAAQPDETPQPEPTAPAPPQPQQGARDRPACEYCGSTTSVHAPTCPIASSGLWSIED